MKKHIFWIVPSVLYLFLLVINQGANYFNRTWFNIKHVVIFGLIIYVLLISLYFVYRFFITRYTEKHTLKYSLMIGLSAIAIASTVLISNIQLKYIDTYEVPHIKECTYYDRYGNVIYKSIFEVCPELNIEHRDQDSLSFSVLEEREGNFSELLSVENGIGTRYFEGMVGYLTEVEITYSDKSIIDSISYSIYETMNKYLEDSTETTGYMFQQNITFDYQQENLLEVIYETKELSDIDLNNSNTFPSFDTIELVMKKYRADKEEVSDVSLGNPTKLTFSEVTYDELGQEVENVFAFGQYDSINEPLIGIDFYEDGVYTGDTTDYSYMYSEIHVKNRQEQRQSTGVDRRYEERTITFIDTPIEFYSDEILEEQLMSDTYLFASFNADLSTAWSGSYNYDFDYTFTEINGDLFVNDSSEFYHKFVFTDYGVRVEEYTIQTFQFSDIFPEKRAADEEFLDVMIDAFNYNYSREFSLKKVINVYDFKTSMMSPGGLSSFHFYQRNNLVEYAFYGVHEKFD